MKLKFFILLVSISIAFACTKKTTTPSSSPTSTASDLSNQKWLLYQYKDATTTTPQLRADTLFFTNATSYTYNGKAYNYYLTLGDYTHLTLGQTPFGDLDGTVPNNFIQNAEIINTPFAQLKATGALTYYLWLKKI